MSAAGNALTVVIGIGAAILLAATIFGLIFPQEDLSSMNGYQGVGVVLAYLIFGGSGVGLLYLFYRRTRTPKASVTA